MAEISSQPRTRPIREIPALLWGLALSNMAERGTTRTETTGITHLPKKTEDTQARRRAATGHRKENLATLVQQRQSRQHRQTNRPKIRYRD